MIDIWRLCPKGLRDPYPQGRVPVGFLQALCRPRRLGVSPQCVAQRVHLPACRGGSQMRASPFSRCPQHVVQSAARRLGRFASVDTPSDKFTEQQRTCPYVGIVYRPKITGC